MSGKSDEHTGGYERGWRDGFDEGFASADGFFVDVDDETLASHGLMRLPVDAHGEQVDVGDDMRHLAGFRLKVVKLLMPEKGRGWFARCTDGGIYPVGILVHAEPDSLERVAEELEAAMKWCDKDGSYGTVASSVSKSTLHTWADRIRKLAKKEDENGN